MAIVFTEKPPEKTLLVSNMHKRFYNYYLTSKDICPVKGVSFKVDAGDSLVLLGPHRSGKAAVLYMITGTMTITRGNCYIGGTSLQGQRSKFIDKLALSIGGLDKFSTGYNNLKRLCLLHGLSDTDAGAFAVTCMAYMGLEQLMHVPVKAYNPGCSRRLGLCAALLAAPPVVLVEKAMQQLEPHSRPLVRRALASLRSRGCAVVMSEHSVAWRDLDSLNTRVAVMNEGQLIALGTVDHIRTLLANGHIARLKLKRKPVPGYVYIKEEASQGELGQHLKFQSKKKKAALGLNQDEEQSKEEIKDKSTRKRNHRDSRYHVPAFDSKLSDDNDTEEVEVNPKWAKAKVDHVSEYELTSRIQSISEEDRSDSIQVEIVHIPYEKDVESDNAAIASNEEEKNENIPEKKDGAESSQSTEKEKKVDTESSQTEKEKKVDTENFQTEKDKKVNTGSFQTEKDKKVDTESSQSEKEKKVDTESSQTEKDKKVDTESSETEKEKKVDTESSQTTEEKNNNIPDQKDEAGSTGQQKKEAQNIPEAEKLGDTENSVNASDKNSQKEDQVGSSDKTETVTPLAAESSKEKKRRSSDGIILEYENLIQPEESQNYFDFRPELTVAELIRDFKSAFPTSHLAEEHVSMLYFYIKDEGDASNVQYCSMFTKLERLKSVYKDLIEDYTLSEISIEDVYSGLERDAVPKGLQLRRPRSDL